MSSIPKWLSWILLIKLAQVYETCSIADALKTGERNLLSIITLALSCKHQTVLNITRIEISSFKGF